MTHKKNSSFPAWELYWSTLQSAAFSIAPVWTSPPTPPISSGGRFADETCWGHWRRAPFSSVAFSSCWRCWIRNRTRRASADPWFAAGAIGTSLKTPHRRRCQRVRTWTNRSIESVEFCWCVWIRFWTGNERSFAASNWKGERVRLFAVSPWNQQRRLLFFRNLSLSDAR